MDILLRYLISKLWPLLLDNNSANIILTHESFFILSNCLVIKLRR
jgi:hypothetical protein